MRQSAKPEHQLMGQLPLERVYGTPNVTKKEKEIIDYLLIELLIDFLID